MIQYLYSFPLHVLQSIGYSSLCYTVGPFRLSILHVVKRSEVAQSCPAVYVNPILLIYRSPTVSHC